MIIILTSVLTMMTEIIIQIYNLHWDFNCKMSLCRRKKFLQSREEEREMESVICRKVNCKIEQMK